MESLARDLEILKDQATEISKKLGLRYYETLMLLILREAIIMNMRVEQWLNRHVEP